MGALLFISFELIREREVAFNQGPLRGSSVPNSLEFGATVAEMGDLCFESGDLTLQCSAILYSLPSRRPERTRAPSRPLWQQTGQSRLRSGGGQRRKHDGGGFQC